MNHPQEVPSNTSHVHWNDDDPKRAERLHCSVRVTATSSRSMMADHQKGRQRDDLKLKINKAVQLELAYLDKAIEVGKKRIMLMRVLQESSAASSKDTNDASHPTNETTATTAAATPSKVQKLTEKIAYATKLEKAWFHRARQVHDKRYRWTKLYEIISMSQQNSCDTAASDKDTSLLPPLVSSLYSEKLMR